MASYTPLPVSAVDDPLTAELVNALRENPLAIAEGAGGAPRVQDAALSGSVTGAGINWVSARVVNNAWNGVGQTVTAYINTDPAPDVVVPGDLRSGSRLSPTNTTGNAFGVVEYLPGTWRCQGRITSSPDTINRVTTWLRVS